MAEDRPAQERLEEVLCALGTGVAVAVSGGVDSMVLAFHAARVLGIGATMYHAVSAAVPPEATRRVERYAETWGWRLKLIDANEFADENYLKNPVNRCFFCKTNLYGTLARHTERQILSGTNVDDLGDFRPGLVAARDHGVRHPLVEAEIGKAAVRALAEKAGLRDLAELPAAPCLSSRITTGVPVTPARVGLVYEVERLLKDTFGPLETVRCRIQAEGVEIQLEPHILDALSASSTTRLRTKIADLCAPHYADARVAFAPYRQGSAFVKEAPRVH